MIFNDLLDKDFIIKNKILIKDKELCGVYFLIKNDEIVYIGSSINVESRINEHQKERKILFDHYFIIKEKYDFKTLEIQYILQFIPKYNTSLGSSKNLLQFGLIRASTIKQINHRCNIHISPTIIQSLKQKRMANEIFFLYRENTHIYLLKDVLNLSEQFYYYHPGIHNQFKNTLFNIYNPK